MKRPPHLRAWQWRNADGHMSLTTPAECINDEFGGRSGWDEAVSMGVPPTEVACLTPLTAMMVRVKRPVVWTVKGWSGHRDNPGTVNRVRGRRICTGWIHGINRCICPVHRGPQIHGYPPVHAMGMTGHDGKDQHKAGKNDDRYKGSHIVLPDGCCRFPLRIASVVPKTMIVITCSNSFVLGLKGSCREVVFRKRTSSNR